MPPKPKFRLFIWKKRTPPTSGGGARKVKKKSIVKKRKQRTPTGKSAPWRCGPLTVEEAFLWPEQFADIMREYKHEFNLFANMLSNVRVGIEFSTDYSGCGQAEAVAGHMMTMLKRGGHDVGQGIRFARAGDIDKTCREVLRAHGTTTPECVSGDITSRMSAELMSSVQRLVTEATETVSASKSAGVHAGRARKDAADTFLQKLRGVMVELKANLQADVEVRGVCYMHKQSSCVIAAPPPTDSRRLRVHVAGVSCIDWTSRGKRAGWSGKTTGVFVQWLYERIVSQEDVIIVECTRLFDTRLLSSILDGYHVQTAVFSPLQLGFGVNRFRVYVLCLRRERMRWGMQCDLATTLQRLFFRSSVLTGLSYFRAPAEHVHRDVLQRARRRSMLDQQSNGKPWEHKHVCGKGMTLRIQRYQELAQQSPQQVHEDDLNFVCDIHHYAEVGAVTRHIPALTRSSEIYSLCLRREMLATEKLEVMGFPYYTADNFPYCTPFRDLVVSGKLSMARLHSLMGNSMHAGCVGAILMLALGCSVPVTEETT